MGWERREEKDNERRMREEEKDRREGMRGKEVVVGAGVWWFVVKF